MFGFAGTVYFLRIDLPFHVVATNVFANLPDAFRLSRGALTIAICVLLFDPYRGSGVFYTRPCGGCKTNVYVFVIAGQGNGSVGRFGIF